MQLRFSSYQPNTSFFLGLVQIEHAFKPFKAYRKLGDVKKGLRVSQKKPQIPADAWPKLTKEIEQQILTLEINLRQLANEHHITEREYKKRLTKIEAFKKRLYFLASAVSSKPPSEPHDWQKLFPQLGRCSSAEQEVAKNYLSNQIEILEHIIKENDPIVKRVEAVQNGGLGIWAVFWFSRLKKSLAIAEKLVIHAQSLKKHSMRRAEVCLRAVADRNQVSGNANPRQLIAVFDKLENTLGQLQISHAVLKKKEAQLNWAQNWVKAQENRLAEYNPHLRIQKNKGRP